MKQIVLISYKTSLKILR